MTLGREGAGRARWKAVLFGAVLFVAPAAVTLAGAQLPQSPDRFAGLEWTFVRIKYHYRNEGTAPKLEKDAPWFIDAPAAEFNLSQRLKSITSMVVHDPIALSLEDPKLFTYPWIYFVQPVYLEMTDKDVATLREFLLRGGTATFDDFHGSAEWDNLQRELTRVFPDRNIVELVPPHGIYTSFYKFDAYPQIPNLASFLQGRMWKNGGFEPHLRAILDDAGRPMILINWNTDIGDGMEWSNAPEFPTYIPYTAQAYRIMINEILYSLTH